MVSLRSFQTLSSCHGVVRLIFNDGEKWTPPETGRDYVCTRNLNSHAPIHITQSAVFIVIICLLYPYTHFQLITLNDILTQTPAYPTNHLPIFQLTQQLTYSNMCKYSHPIICIQRGILFLCLIFFSSRFPPSLSRHVPIIYVFSSFPSSSVLLYSGLSYVITVFSSHSLLPILFVSFPCFFLPFLPSFFTCFINSSLSYFSAYLLRLRCACSSRTIGR